MAIDVQEHEEPMPATTPEDQLAEPARGVEPGYARPTVGRAGAGVLTLGPVTLSRECREVRVDGEEIALTPKEFELLGYLMERPGVVVSRETLLRDVWGYAAMGATRTLDSHASRLRRKLGDAGRRWIVNVWGVGYRLTDRLE